MVASTLFIYQLRLNIIAKVEKKKSQFCTFLGKLCCCHFFILDLIFTRLYKAIRSKLLYREKRVYFCIIIHMGFILT